MKMPIPTDWDGVSFCRWAVCWPDSPYWKAILDGLLTQPSQGRFWDEQTGYIKGVQASFLPAYLANFRLKEVIMACGDSGIAEALTAIANALTLQATTGQGGSCGGSLGGGSPDVYCYNTLNSDIQNIITLPSGESWPIYGTVPIAAVPESGYPPEYPSFPAYDADKCAKANQIVTDWISTLRHVGSISWFEAALGASVLVACFVGLITMPAVAIPVALYLLLTTATISTACVGLADLMDSHYQELVCALYEHPTVEDVLGSVSDVLDSLITILDPGAGVAIALKKIALLFLSADTINRLFSSEDKDLYPTADCTCEDAYWTMYNGEQPVQVSPGVWHFISDGPVDCGGVSTHNISAGRFTGSAHLIGSWTIAVVAGTLTPPGGGGGSCENSWRGIACDETEVYGHADVPPSFPINASSFTLRSSAAFEVEVTITDEGTATC